MEIKLVDFGSGIPQNQKEVILKLIEFCSQHYPYKKNIKVILLNNQSDSELESNYEKLCIPTRNKNLSNILIDVTNKWINLFVSVKRVNLAGGETELLINKFLENNGNYQNLL